MQKIKRLAAVLTVFILVASVFTMLAMPAEGAAVSDEDLTPDEEYGWLSDIHWESDIDDTGEPDEDVYVGQRNVRMNPEFTENHTEETGHEVNITHSKVLVEDVARLVGDDWDSEDEDDWTDGSGYFEWTKAEIEEETGPFDGSEWLAQPFVVDPFEFNVTGDATPGIYRIPIEMEIENTSDFGTTWETLTEDNLEYVWLEVTGNAEVHGFELEPGMEFEQIMVDVSNVGDQGLEDVYLTLEEDDLEDDDGNQVTIHNPDDTSYVDYISWGMQRALHFRFTVPLEMEPGEYEVNYTLEATREDDEVIVTEHGTITVTISEVAELSAEIVENEVVQGTPKQEFTVTFTNTGNLDLERISVLPVADDPFFRPQEYYLYSSATSDDPMIDIGDLDVGASTDVDMILGIEQDIQIGEHKFYFAYEAYYYDYDGEITGSEGFYDVHDWGLVADTDEPYAWIEVLEPDVTREIGAYELNPIRVTDMGYQVISLELRNHGRVTYNDVTVHLHTEGTPFIHPEDPEQETIEMIGRSFTLHHHGEIGPPQREIYFGVLIDTDFIEERLEEDRQVYTAELTFEGINGDTLEEVEYTLHTEGYVYGVGPKIMVREPAEENVVSVNESFELTYIIENIGDEAVRNLEVTITPTVEGVGTFFEDGQEAIYYRQASLPPGAYVSTVEPEQEVLEPGEETTVTFHMKPSVDMQEGALYSYELTIRGETATPWGEEVGNEEWTSGTTIRTEEETSTRPEKPEEPMIHYNLALVLVALILGIFFAIGLLLHKKGNSKPKGEKKAEPKEEPEAFEETYEETSFKESESEEIPPEPEETEETMFEEEGTIDEEEPPFEEPEDEDW